MRPVPNEESLLMLLFPRAAPWTNLASGSKVRTVETLMIGLIREQARGRSARTPRSGWTNATTSRFEPKSSMSIFSRATSSRR